MSSMYTLRAQAIVDVAREFEYLFRKARHAGVTFLQTTATQLIKKLESIDEVDTVTESQILRTIRLSANSSISGQFRAWKLPGMNLFIVKDFEGFVQIDDSNGKEAIYVPSESLFTSPDFDEESDYIKTADAIAKLDEAVNRRQQGGDGVKG